jgi:hypothetical protein
VNYLPNRISLTSETAPPPVNPRLQFCMEKYVAEQFAQNGDTIRSAISTARELPIDVLPDDLAKDMSEALDKADAAFGLMDEILATSRAVDEASGDYRPLHVQVRALERDARKLDEHIEEERTTVTRLKSTNPDSPRIPKLEAAIARQTEERDALLARIPAEWEETHTVFAKLTKAEDTARNQYRRNADQAFEPVNEVITIIASTDDLAALEDELRAIRADVDTADPPALVERIEELRSAMRSAEAGRDTVKGLSDARKVLRKDPDRAAAAEALDAAIAALTTDLAWRREAQEKLLPGLQAYSAALSDTIGLRQQPVLPPEQALYVASCTASHRDISLNF